MAESKNLQLFLQLASERAVLGQASRKGLAESGRLAARDTEWSPQPCLALGEPWLLRQMGSLWLPKSNRKSTEQLCRKGVTVSAGQHK